MRYRESLTPVSREDPTVKLVLSEDGYTVRGLDWSPIRGADGNIEFLCHLRNTESAEYTPDSLITAVVEAAHGGQP